MSWEKVEEFLEQADSIAFDGCHKIYVLGDVEQTKKMIGYEYEFVEPVTDVEQAYKTLERWFSDSCGLKFIEFVGTNEDGTDLWETLIGQGELDVCEDCGESYCVGCYEDEDEEDED